MLIRQHADREPFAAELADMLAAVRATRRFDADAYIQVKAAALNEYATVCGLTAAVVAVSGGVDSAVVAGLVAHAAAQPGSPLRRVVCVTAPVHTSSATHQSATVERARQVCDRFGLVCHVLDLTDAHAMLSDTVTEALGLPGNSWASGQLVATTRTPAFYFVTSLLATVGERAVLVGTTNRDEGAYLGYVGKASDAMVDVQPISDIHKSEVYATAETLGVPRSVIEVIPNGDMFDGLDDVDVFGADYDFVELFLALKAFDASAAGTWVESLPAVAAEQFRRWSDNLEA